MIKSGTVLGTAGSGQVSSKKIPSGTVLGTASPEVALIEKMERLRDPKEVGKILKGPATETKRNLKTQLNQSLLNSDIPGERLRGLKNIGDENGDGNFDVRDIVRAKKSGADGALSGRLLNEKAQIETELDKARKSMEISKKNYKESKKNENFLENLLTLGDNPTRQTTRSDRHGYIEDADKYYAATVGTRDNQAKINELEAEKAQLQKIIDGGAATTYDNGWADAAKRLTEIDKELKQLKTKNKNPREEKIKELEEEKKKLKTGNRIVDNKNSRLKEIKEEIKQLKASEGEFGISDIKDVGEAINRAPGFLGDIAHSAVSTANRGVMSTADATLGNLTSALGWKKYNIFREANEGAKALDNDIQSRLADEAYSLGDKYNITGTIANAIGSSAPTAILAIMTGGTGAAAGLAAQGGNAVMRFSNALCSMAKNPAYWTSFIQVFGQSYESAKEENANESQAYTFALLNSAVNAAIEIGGGVETLPGELQEAAQYGGRRLWEWFKAGLSEGGEEMMQKAAENIIGTIAYGHDPLNGKSIGENLKDTLKEGAYGAIGGLFLGGAQLSIDAALNARTNSQYKAIGESLIKEKPESIDSVIRYAARSAEPQIREYAEIARSLKSSDPRITGILYSYTLSDLYNTLGAAPDIEALNEGMKLVTDGKPGKFITDAAGAFYTWRYLELGAAETSLDADLQLDEFYRANGVELSDGQNAAGTSPETDVSSVQAENANLQSTASEDVLHEPDTRDIAEKPDFYDILNSQLDGKAAKESKHRHIERVANEIGLNVSWNESVSRGKYIPSERRIVINPNLKTAEMYNFVLKHEFTHYLENKKGYDSFKEYVFKDSSVFEEWVRSRLEKSGISREGSRSEVIKRLTEEEFKAYKNSSELSKIMRDRFTAGNAEAEVLADFVGDNLFGTGDRLDATLAELSRANKRKPGLLQRIRDFIRDMINRFKGNKKYGSLVNDLKYLNSRLEKVMQSGDKKTSAEQTEKYSIAYTTDNKPVAVIDEDILDGVPKSQWIQTVKDTISGKFSGGIPISGRLIKVNKITRNEYISSKYSKYLKSTDGTMYQDKLKAADNLDDIVLAATNYINEDLKHERKDSFREFARGDVLIKVGENDYSAKVIVGFTGGKQMVLYDVVAFNRASFDIKEKTSRTAMLNAGSDRNGMSSDITVPQNEQSVNTNISENVPNDTEKHSIAALPADKLLDLYDNGEISREEYLKTTDNKIKREALGFIEDWERQSGYALQNGDVTQEEINTIDTFSWQLAERYGLDSPESIHKKLLEFYRYAKNTRNIFGVEERAKNIAEEIAESSVNSKADIARAKAALKDIRNLKIGFWDTQNSVNFEKAETYEEYSDLRKKNKLLINDQKALESAWNKLSQKYPDIFGQIAPEKMRTSLFKIITRLQNTGNQAAVSKNIADEIYNFCVLNNKQFASERERMKMEEQREIQRQSQDRTANMNTIRRTVRKIDHALRANAHSKHIPEAYRKAATELCALFVDNDKPTFLHKELSSISKYYEKMKGKGESADAPQYDPYIAEILDELTESLDGKSLADLDNHSLILINQLVGAFNKAINDEAQVFIDNKKAAVTSIGNAALNEIRNAKTTVVNKALNNEKLEQIRGFIYEGNLTPVYFFKRMGATFEEVYNLLVKGQERWARTMQSAKGFVSGLMERYGYRDWKNDTVKFRTDSGRNLEISVNQALQLVATANREKSNNGQTSKHLCVGGVVIDTEIMKNALKEAGKKDAEIKKIFGDLSSRAVQITFNDVKVVEALLTEQQKGYMKEMVDYLSTQCAAWGNEVTMELYGYRQFLETNYFPYRSSETFLAKDPARADSTILKSASFTKSLQENASNPLMLTSFTDIALQHIEGMCNYNAMAVPLDTLNKLFNYQTESEEGKPPRGVKAEIEHKFGKEAVKYMENFIRDLNNGVRGDPNDSVLNSLSSKFKKSAVLANLSVVIQQPSAIFRGLRDIDAKYYLKASRYYSENNYEECKQYAGVAVIKEMGRFDTGIGVKNTTWLSGESTFSERLDENLGAAAGKADEIAWSFLWSAVKAEIADTTSLKVGSDEFLTKAGERFTQLVNETQVYDSVLVKSQNMRNKGVAGALTSFAAEPTLTVNMLVNSFLDFKEGKASGKKLARTVMSVLVADIINSLLQSIITAARDDDEDKSYIEKYFGNVVSNSLGNISIFSKIPYIRDLKSIYDGYDVERQDTAVFADLIEAVKATGSESKTPAEKTRKLAEAAANVFGIPLKNVLRDAEAIATTLWNFAFDDVTDENGNKKIVFHIGGKTTADGIKVSMLEGISENNILKPWHIDHFDYSKSGEYGRMERALKKGDEKAYQKSYDRLKDKGVSDSDIRTGVTKQFKDNKDVKKEANTYYKELKNNDTYKSLSADDKEKLTKDITTALAKKAMVNSSERKPSEYERLYELYCTDRDAYKELRSEMLKSGKTERQIKDGFEIGKYAYLQSIGIDLHKYLLYKISTSAKYADTDNSGGVSKAEKEEALDKMDIDDKTRQQIRQYLNENNY